MTERYTVWQKTNLVDTHQKSAAGHDCPRGLIVAYADPEMTARLAALLNEDEVINGILEMSKGQCLDDFVDDVVRHTKVQQ
jgi:hypothetical protein